MNINFAIILDTIGIFGGAERRFTNLFKYLYEKYPENVYYFVSYDLLDKIKKIYPDYPLRNVIPIGNKNIYPGHIKIKNNSSNRSSGQKRSTDISLLRKCYRWMKSYKIKYVLFTEIEKYRKKYNINVFMGIYSGILPLYFYLNQFKREIGIIFSDMDSWFMDIYPKGKKNWFRKYASFNYALERSDYVDLLSPFILEGVLQRGIEIKEGALSITPCSFTDYSKCSIGDKSVFQVAFAARLEKDKNPEMFLDAAELLSNKYPNIVFQIMGEGRLSEIVKNRVAECNIKNIVFHGFHPNPPEIFAETSVFVSIQSSNNYPSQSVLEAMACGNAIIATNVGDTRMFINENNGILITLDKNKLYEAIETIYLNRKQSKEMGEYAAKYVRGKHTIEKSAEYYMQLFERAYKIIKRNK